LFQSVGSKQQVSYIIPHSLWCLFVKEGKSAAENS